MQYVLSPARAAAQAVVVQKVDQHAPPPPEEDDVQAVGEVAHHHPPSVHDVCDRQLVTDEQGGIVISVFLLYHIRIFILRRFFPQLLPSSLSHLGKPPPPTPPSQDQYIPCPTNLLHIPQPPLSIVRVRNTTVWSLYPPRQCVYAMPCVSSRPGRAVDCQSAVSR